MRLPSKSTYYKNSIIALFPIILHTLKEKDQTALTLFHASGIPDVGDFANALDCLFALGKIELKGEGGLIHYVDTDTL